MLMLITSKTTGVIYESNFNTSHVNVNHVVIKPGRENIKISIHLMLMLIGEAAFVYGTC